MKVRSKITALDIVRGRAPLAGFDPRILEFTWEILPWTCMQRNFSGNPGKAPPPEESAAGPVLCKHWSLTSAARGRVLVRLCFESLF